MLGLGNPGQNYECTRHNVGFSALNQSAAFFQVHLKKRCFRPYQFAPGSTLSDSFLLIKPLTWMNASGQVFKFVPVKQDDTLIVICDNMDLKPGEIRVKFGGSSAGQKGLHSIIETLKTGDFFRIYVGIGRPAQGVSVVEHVLGAPQGEDAVRIADGIARASHAVNDLLSGKLPEEVMREANVRLG